MGHSDDFLPDDKSTPNILIPTSSVFSTPDFSSTPMYTPSYTPPAPIYVPSDPTTSIPTTITTKTTYSPSPENNAIYGPSSSISSTTSSSSEFIPTTSSSTSHAPTKTSSSNLQANDFNNQNHNFWESLAQGVKAGIIVAVIIGIIAIVIASIWFCCGRPRSRRRRESRRLEDADSDRGAMGIRGGNRSREVERPPMPLRTIYNSERPDGAPTWGIGMDRIPRAEVGRQVSVRGAPPQYEEVVPPAHHRLAGGMRNSIMSDDEAGMGVVADGKMPLSEIPFEDVVLEPVSSHSSQNREFNERHRMGGGDTRGHTNS